MTLRSKLNQTIISFICFLVLIVMVCFVDVAAIGPNGTSIGLAHLNKAVFDLFGVNMTWYTITDWLGLSGIAVALIFAFTGFIQLIKRKSLVKVDKEILALGVLYIIVICLYLFFEKVIVNYRPIIMPGCTDAEASFPSSHTMITCVIMGSAFIVLKKYITNPKLLNLLRILVVLIACLTVAGRLISGVHWFTDILGGLLLSSTLISLFDLTLNSLK